MRGDIPGSPARTQIFSLSDQISHFRSFRPICAPFTGLSLGHRTAVTRNPRICSRAVECADAQNNCMMLWKELKNMFSFLNELRQRRFLVRIPQAQCLHCGHNANHIYPCGDRIFARVRMGVKHVSLKRNFVENFLITYSIASPSRFMGIPWTRQSPCGVKMLQRMGLTFRASRTTRCTIEHVEPIPSTVGGSDVYVHNIC